MIAIKSISGEMLLSVPVLKDAVSHEELMVSDYVHLTWDSERGDILPAGAYVEYEGERYSLLEPYKPSMQNESAFRYSPQFHSRIIRWQKIIVPVYTYSEDGATIRSRELDWSFTGTPADLMSMIQRAIMHETGEAWNFSIAEGLKETVTVSAQSSSIWSVLSDLAEQCETEWWADKAAHWLYLSKCSHGVGVTLEVGRNVRVPSVISNREEYYTRFYAFGSSRNITQSEGVVQGSIINKRLCLDTRKYPNGYKDIKGHFEDGVFVSDLLPEEVMVKSLYFEDIYPSSPLALSEVRRRMRYRTDDDGNKVRIGGDEENPVYEQYAIWYFKLKDFEFTEDLIIEGKTLSVAFKTGRLQGREFELTYHPEAKKVSDNADVDKEFAVEAGEYEIIFDESNGMIIPDDDYIIPAVGNEVVLFNINMPDEYKASAQLELEKKLDEAIGEYVKDNDSYEFESNPVLFHEEGTDVHLGQTVTFINDGHALETRALMVEKRLDYPFEQKIRIGNVRISGSRKQLMDEVRNISEEVGRMGKTEAASGVLLRDHTRDLMLTMGRYFAMSDTIKMLQEAVEGYTGGINPVTVETMAMLVGDESLQYRFTASRTDLTPLENCPLVYDASSKQLNADPCALIHMTLGITSMTARDVRTAADYRSWDMEEWHSELFEDAEKAYYVYAVVEENGDKGTYAYYEKPKKMREINGVLHLLVGILNVEYVGTRELITLYGFTEILPSRVTTDKIVSADGSCYFDLARNEIGGRINFLAGSSGILESGGQNMLRNSGFTGDYLSERLADDIVLDAASQMYNNPLVYWEGSVNAKVNEDEQSESGRSVTISNGVLTQQLYYKTIAGERYILSFKAKGTCALTLSAGGGSYAISIDSEEYRKYTCAFVSEQNASGFAMSVAGVATLCELQLERGNVASPWGNSPFDNSSDRTYYQALQYLQAALKGSTTIDGGLVLTNLIQLGDYSNDSEFVERAGANGKYVDDDSPAFWAGGTMADAVELIRRIRNGETDLAGLADFVVTHGGMAVLRNIQLFADNGSLGGLKVTDKGLAVDTESEGNIEFTNRGIVASQKDSSFAEIGTCGSQALLLMGKDAEGGQCYPDDNKYKIAAQINAADKGHAVHSLSGLYAGLRPNIRVIYEDDTLDALDHTVIVDNGSQMTLTLPSTPRTGQTYKIIHRSDKPITISSRYVMLDVSESYARVDTISTVGVTVLTYYDEIWYVELK